MKKQIFATIGIGIIFTVAQIYKHHRYLAMVYALQKAENTHLALTQEKNKLLMQMHTLTNLQNIEAKAKELGMQKVSVNTINPIHLP